MRKFVHIGKPIGEIVYKNKNIVIEKVREGTKKDICYIVGTGYSLSVDDNDLVSQHDPFMDVFSIKTNDEVTVYSFYFRFESSGLEESSRELADFINNLNIDYKDIYLIGQSKCGICSYNASHYINKKINLVTISAPFKGTPIADKDSVKKAKANRFIKGIYKHIFSDHNVDRDIIPNSKFIQELKTPKYEKHINIMTKLNKSDCKNFADLFLLCMDRILELNGDGVVPYESQRIDATTTIDLVSNHATSLQNGIYELEKLIIQKN